MSKELLHLDEGKENDLSLTRYCTSGGSGIQITINGGSLCGQYFEADYKDWLAIRDAFESVYGDNHDVNSGGNRLVDRQDSTIEEMGKVINNLTNERDALLEALTEAHMKRVLAKYLPKN